jgi:hypothetical protein
MYTSPQTGFELEASLVIGIGCTGSCNYKTITTTTIPIMFIGTQHRFTWSVFEVVGFPICFIFHFLAYLMKVILSIPDEGYFEHT